MIFSDDCQFCIAKLSARSHPARRAEYLAYASIFILRRLRSDNIYSSFSIVSITFCIWAFQESVPSIEARIAAGSRGVVR